MTTIGYGDLSPQTPVAKVLAMLYLPIVVTMLADAITQLNSVGAFSNLTEFPVTKGPP